MFFPFKEIVLLKFYKLHKELHVGLNLGERLALSEPICQKHLNEHAQDVKGLQIASIMRSQLSRLSGKVKAGLLYRC